LAIQERISLEQLLGGFLIASVLLFILYKDIVRYKPAYINNYNMLLLFCLLLVFTLSTGRLFSYLLYSLSKGTGFIPIGSYFRHAIASWSNAITFFLTSTWQSPFLLL
jgi:hypothetical protein